VLTLVKLKEQTKIIISSTKKTGKISLDLNAHDPCHILGIKLLISSSAFKMIDFEKLSYTICYHEKFSYTMRNFIG